MIPLADWQFRFDDDPTWRPIAVPAAWEDAGYPKDRAGPAWYRTSAAIPSAWDGRRIWLRFGAVSYHAEVYINGALRGTHTGLWDPFQVEITSDVAPGAPFEVRLRVEKPASLSAGPASPPLPGAFPLKSTLSGFLPYVWGHMFGGLWQPAVLASTGAVVFEEASARGTPDGQVEISAALSAPARVSLELYGPDGALIASSVSSATSAAAAFSLTLDAAAIRPWSPADPALYTAVLRVEGSDERVVRFGLRSLRAAGATLLLNDRPIYPRMILSWGWYAGRLSPDPGPARVRQDFAKLKQLGYNGVKLCLWFPPQYYFDLADEMGLLLWVELPMWLPEPDEHFRHQAPLEYERLVKLARQHPAVILYSLGCELNRAVGPEILGPLYALVKRLAGDALVRDNSGSGEAYGGLLNEFADYYDYHFYCDLQFFRGLVDYFSPRWRPEQPWVFGEFCDYDTFRDPRRMQNEASHMAHEEGHQHASLSMVHAAPWWLSPDPSVNPQGARWQMDVPHHEERLRANGYWERGAELERLSALHGLLHRKVTLELVRTYREIAGYVVTGEVDTPISTAGMWDDAGRVKFDPAAFSAFNGDLVLVVGWDRRRDWIHGGDRAAYWDCFCYTAGALVRPHLIASHYGVSSGPAHVRWSVALDGEPPFAAGESVTPFALAPGAVRELAVAEFLAPEVATPRRAILRAHLRAGDEEARNEWPLWFFPRGAWDGLDGVALLDPAGRLEELRRLAPAVIPITVHDLTDNQRSTTNDQPSPASEQGDSARSSFVVRRSSAVVIASEWTAGLDAFVRGGGRAILLQAADGPPGPLRALPMPFWREALRLCEPHPAWGDFPHDGWAGLQFYGCATDHALDTMALAAPVAPILRRIDTRTVHVHDYAAELAWGAGRLIASTLRFAGGHGDQPVGLARNTAAAYLLSRWARYLCGS
ncbi:MAG TPA: glycoside hydrolase [Roseiflexaceae bacterium]|nr:glycoside hydrolase [Roseiflexaceae bacterium]